METAVFEIHTYLELASWMARHLQGVCCQHCTLAPTSLISLSTGLMWSSLARDFGCTLAGADVALVAGNLAKLGIITIEADGNTGQDGMWVCAVDVM
jgi:hypothetical protein